MTQTSPPPIAAARRSMALRWAMTLVWLGLLAVLVGPTRVGLPSQAPHYTYLARSWLQGRLDLGESPPGFATRSHDDWARIVSIERADGDVLEGRPCVTNECASHLTQLRAETGRRYEAYLPLASASPVYVASQNVSKRSQRWYVSFPPAPAVLMLPLTALLGEAAPDRIVTLILAALVPWLLLRLLVRRRTGRTDVASTPEERWVVGATCLASPLVVVAANPSVWFMAQISCVVATIVYVDATIDLRRPALAGGALAFAMACRPHVVLAASLFVWIAVKRRAPLGHWARFLAPILLVGAALAWHNTVRFHDPLEFGHAYLDVRWQRRMQEVGLFSFVYLPRNLACLLLLPPVFVPHRPYLIASVHGIALTFTAPWLAYIFSPLRSSRQEIGATEHRLPHGALLLTAALVALPNLLYQNSGQVQFTYRFALDWLVFLLPALASGPWPRARSFRLLVAASAALCLHGAYWSSQAPARAFVLSPLGWPFEAELRDP